MLRRRRKREEENDDGRDTRGKARKRARSGKPEQNPARRREPARVVQALRAGRVPGPPRARCGDTSDRGNPMIPNQATAEGRNVSRCDIAKGAGRSPRSLRPRNPANQRSVDRRRAERIDRPATRTRRPWREPRPRPSVELLHGIADDSREDGSPRGVGAGGGENRLEHDARRRDGRQRRGLPGSPVPALREKSAARKSAASACAPRNIFTRKTNERANAPAASVPRAPVSRNRGGARARRRGAEGRREGGSRGRSRPAPSP